MSKSIPDVEVTAKKYRASDGTYLYELRVHKCPFCGRKHNHGGGPYRNDLILGYRVAHCITPGPNDTYNLVMTEGDKE